MRLKRIIQTTLVIAVCAASTALAACDHVSLSAGRTAIEHFASRVARETNASSFRVSGCSGRGSGVSCSVRLNNRNNGVYCLFRAGTYYRNRSLKVRRLSGIKCRAFSSTS